MTWLVLTLAAVVSDVQTLELAPLDIFTKPLICVSSDGVICLVKDRSSLVFLDGATVTVKGRKGQAPGEFSDISDIQWFPDQAAFAVHDGARRRLSLWSPAGQLIREIRLETDLDPEFPPALTQDRLVYFDTPSGQIRDTDFIGDTTRDLAPFELEPRYTMRVPISGTDMTLSYLWDPHLIVRARGDRIVVSYPAEGRLLFIRTSPTVTHQNIDIPIARKPTTDEDEAEARAQLAFHLKKSKHFDRPTFWPAFSEILLDTQGRTWVFGYPTTAGYPFVVLTEEGSVGRRDVTAHLPSTIAGSSFYTCITQHDEWVLRITPTPSVP